MNFKARTIQETSRQSDIFDVFGHARFRVSLDNIIPEAREEAELRVPGAKFCVSVTSMSPTDGGQTIVCEFFRYYDEAVDAYNSNVEQYNLLSKAECRDFNNINIYADRINYHKINPDCCANCRWAKQKNKENSTFSDWKKAGCGSKYICMNSSLFSVHKDGMRPDHVKIRPEVDGDCICEHYIRTLPEYFRDPGHSDWAFKNHDCMPENIQETIIKKEVRKNMPPPPEVIGGGAADDEKIVCDEELAKQFENMGA